MSMQVSVATKIHIVALSSVVHGYWCFRVTYCCLSVCLCLQPCPVLSSVVSVPIIHLPEYTVFSTRKSEYKILVYLEYYFCAYEYTAICTFLYKQHFFLLHMSDVMPYPCFVRLCWSGRRGEREKERGAGDVRQFHRCQFYSLSIGASSNTALAISVTQTVWGKYGVWDVWGKGLVTSSFFFHAV